MGRMNSLPRVSPMSIPSLMKRGRWFHVGVALGLIVLVLWGFQHFYFHGRAYPGRELTPPIRTLVIMHGLAMAGWLGLLLVQALLITKGKRRLHMTLGKLGAVLALTIVVLGVWLAIAATRVNPPEMKIWGLTGKQFLTVPLVSMVLFGGFVTAGVVNRRRPELHRALMLLGTLAVVSAAVARIDPLSALYAGTVWERLFGPFFITLLLAVALLPVKWMVTWRFDRHYALGCVILTGVSALTMLVAPTAAWEAVAGWLLR
jgi:hypothetical protein